MSATFDEVAFGNWILEFRRAAPAGECRVSFTNDRGQVFVCTSGLAGDRRVEALRGLELLAPDAFLRALEALA
jgi:hypothetical protein